jgi:PAS domain S-box-containing protein
MSHYDKKEKRTLAVYVFLFILLAAGIAMGGYISYRNFEQQFRAQAERQLSSIAELKVNGLVAWRKERLADASLVYQNPTFSALVERFFKNPDDAPAQAELRMWLEKYEAYGQYERISLLDVQGVERISIPAASEPVSAYSADQAASALSSNQVTFLDFHRDTDGGPVHLSILVPIFAAPGSSHPLGVLIMRIDPHAYLYPFIQNWPTLSTTSESLLVRRDGNNVLFLNELRFNPGAALTLRYPLTDTALPSVKAVLGQTGVVEGMDYHGVSVVADVRPVPDSPWFLVSKMDTAEVYAPLRDRLWQILALVCMAILVAGAGLATIWRQQRIQFYRTQAEAAEALRNSEIRYRRLFEAARDGILILDAESGVVVDVNPFLIEILGFSREEIFGKKLWELGFFKDIAANKDNFLELQKKEYIRYEDLPLETADGRRLNVEFVSNVYQVDHHKVVQCNIRDITERKLAEAALRQAEAKYRSIFENAIVGIYQTTPAGKFFTANLALARILGYASPEELIAGINDLNREFYVQPGRREEFMNPLRDNGTISNFESEIYRKDGTSIWVSENAKILHDDQGQERYEGTLIDITDRKQVENMIAARLRLVEFAAKHSLEELLQKTLDEVCAVTDSPIGFYHFVELDQKTLSLQAWSTRTLQEYCKTEDKSLHNNVDEAGVWVDCIRQRQPVIHNDYASLPASQRKGLPEGHAELVRELVVPVLREDWIVAILGVGNKAREYTERDVDVAAYFADVAWEIVERKRAEQQLAAYTGQLEEMVDERTRELSATQEQLVRQERLAVLGQLAGSVGHELRNPLGVISNAIYFLKMAQPNADDKVKEYLNIIEKETRTSNKIITDLLDFTRIKSVEREAVSVSDLFRQTLERFPVLPSVEATLEIPTGLPKVYADPHHMVQVLGNLVVNACQSMPKGGNLTVSARAQDGMIYISIHDTGIGIPPENISKLFEPLFTTKTKGIGLGLAVSRKLIEANGGRIEVQSEAGKGSTFSVYLPVYDANAIPIPARDKDLND